MTGSSFQQYIALSSIVILENQGSELNESVRIQIVILNKEWLS